MSAIMLGIGQLSGGGAKSEDLIEIAGKGRKLVSRAILPSHEGKNVASVYPPIPGLALRRNNSRLISEIFSRWSFSVW